MIQVLWAYMVNTRTKQGWMCIIDYYMMIACMCVFMKLHMMMTVQRRPVMPVLFIAIK